MRSRQLTINIFLIILLILGVFSVKADASDVVVILSSNIAPYNKCYEGFKENTKISYSHYYLPDSERKIEKLLEEIMKEDPKVILTIGTKAFETISEVVEDIPIIFTMVLNPKMPKSRTNISGITMNIDLEVRIKFLKKILPNAKNVGVVFSKEMISNYSNQIDEVEKKNGIVFHKLICESDSDLYKHLNNDFNSKVDCLLLFPDPILLNDTNFNMLLTFSFQNNIPLIGVSPKFVKKGALYGLYSDYYKSGKQASDLIKKVIAGVKVSNIPIEDIKDPNLIFNKKISDKMKINVDEDILNSAQTVYE